MTVSQFLFVIGFLIVCLVIVAAMAGMYVRARQLDGGGQLRLARVAGIGAGPEYSQSSQYEAYRFAETNRYAAYLHRFTGIAVALFLVLHLFDVSLFVWSAPIYDEVHTIYGTAIMRIFECGLLFALMFHALNGLRILAIDIWDIGMASAIKILQIVFITSILTTLLGSAVILWPILN